MPATTDQKAALETWSALNDLMRDCNEDIAKSLLEVELNEGKRLQFALRIHSRINKLRADRERKELKDKLHGKQN